MPLMQRFMHFIARSKILSDARLLELYPPFRQMRIKVLEIVSFGSLGRVYLAGEDRDIDVAWPAAENAVKALAGRAGK